MAGTITRTELAASIRSALDDVFGTPPSAAEPAWDGASEAIADGIINAFTSEIDDGDFIRRDGTELIGDTASSGGVTYGSPVSVSTALSDGVATTVARSDHVHSIANNAVGDAQIRDSAACSVIGRSANSSGDPADISASTNDRVLARQSNALSWVQVTDAMIANMGARSVKGRAANSSGVAADIAGAGAGTILSDDGSALAFRSLSALGASRLLAIPATIAITSTTPTDTIAYDLPASTLNSARLLDIEVHGDLINTSGANRQITVSIQVEGVTLWEHGSTVSIGTSANRRMWNLRFKIFAPTPTTARCNGLFFLSAATAPTTGIGNEGLSAAMDYGLASAATDPTVDWTIIQTISTVITLSSGVSTDFRVRGGAVELKAVS